MFFGWGEIFSLFPSTLTDTFGTRNATRNYGCLYMAQGIGAIFGGPLASLLHDATGSWVSVFAVAIAADLTHGGAGDRRAEAAPRRLHADAPDGHCSLRMRRYW